jgi:hypothetical protein
LCKIGIHTRLIIVIIIISSGEVLHGLLLPDFGYHDHFVRNEDH